MNAKYMGVNKTNHMWKVLLLFIFLILMLPRLVMSEPIRLIEIRLSNHDEVYALNRYKITIIDASRDFARALVNDKEISILRNAGYNVRILINDYKAYKDEIFSRGFYHTYNQVYLVLDSFVTNYPSLCHLDTIGNSIQGRPIWAMRVTDNPTVEENETEIRLGGNIHGDEHIGTEVTLYFLRHLLTSYASNPQVQNLVNNREIWILPTLNPDGKYSNTRGNANGIDLNRDYGFMWDGWSGSPSPSSQIENQHAMRHLTENNISLEYNYHSAAYYVNYLWDYSPADPPDSQYIINLSQIYADSSNLTIINGYDWYQVCGSLQDYTFGTSGSLAWTIETDEPAGSSAIDQICYENRDALMELCNRAGWGIEGVVRDSLANTPLYARIEITSPQRVEIYSDPNLGDFHKMIQQGTYTIRVSANGYVPKTVSNVVVPATGSINLGNIRLASNPNWLYAFRPVIARYSQHAEQSNKTEPRSATGANDNVFFSLGQGGFIVLDMGPNTPIVNISGNDFTVYEGNDGTNEGYTVRASNNWNGSWNSCGTGTGTQSFDLTSAGMSQARYIRIEDDNSSSSGQYAGFDLDAIGFLASLLGLPQVPTYIKPLDYAKLPVLQPTLSFQSDDPQGDNIQYRVLWDTDPGFGSPDSATTSIYPSGTPVDLVIPVPLANGATYWWKIKCTDPAGSGYWTTYTAPRSFTIDTSLPMNTCTWFQTTGAQFAANTHSGTVVQGDSVVLGMNTPDTLLTEGFEPTTFPPTDWARFAGPGNGSTNDWARQTDQYHSGSASAGIKYDGSNRVDRFLVTTRVSLMNAANARLVFWTRDNYASYYEYHGVWVSTSSQTNPSAFTEVAIIDATAEDTWEERIIDLSAYDGRDTIYVAFRYNELDGADWWIDDVKIVGDVSSDYGGMTGVSVVYNELSKTYPRQRWGDAVWRKATASDSIGLQVEYYNGATWQLVPNSLIPGNSTGKFSHLAVDTVKLTNVDTVTYNPLRLKALFYRITKAPGNPALLDWEVGNLSSYIGVEETEGMTGLGAEFGLRVFPTVFQNQMQIRCTMHDAGSMIKEHTLKVYDISGRVVRDLSSNLVSGIVDHVSVVSWNGNDDTGRRVPAGVYFVRLETEDQQAVQKAVLLR